MKKTTVLMILDGFGYSEKKAGNAIAAASTPRLDAIFKKYPHTLLGASGLAVGLPDGQMGNSEVGHMNIGAGRIIYQELTRITKEIKDKNFEKNAVIADAMAHVIESNSTLHVMGLLSDGGVHSHIEHLFAIIDMAKARGVCDLCVHCFLDGRDVPPRSAEIYLDELEEHLKKVGLGRIASISGRYYAMDRDKRWERIEKAYDALTLGTGETASSAKEALAKAYDRDENDEFVLPTVITDAAGEPAGTIKTHDSVIMYNFRPDRAREITRALVDPAFDGFVRASVPGDLCYVCMTEYDATMPAVAVAFPPEHHKNTLGEWVAAHGMSQLRTAETEKYAHVTFFFNGGVEEPNSNEDRKLIPSPKVATYDLMPEMSALAVKDTAVEAIKSGAYDLIVMNFANPDMVGHTGVFDAAVKAVETVDACVGEICDALAAVGGDIFITADHGNADTMVDDDGHVITAHSTNPVPAVLVTAQPGIKALRTGGVLADIAPTILELLGLEQPAEMTGTTLIVR